MHIVEIVYWWEDGSWIGNIQEFPANWTQGDSLEDLESHLLDLCTNLTSDALLGIRKVADIAIA